MKKILLLVLLAILIFASAPTYASQWDINNILNNLGKGSATTQQTDSSQSKSTAGGLGNLLSGVANKFGIGSSNLTIGKLVGTWRYSGPAVTFKSDNLLLKAGGAAAASQVEAKLEPYYKTAGFTSLVMTINEDSTFTFKARLMTLNGTIARDEKSGNFIFTFMALKSINIGSMESYIVMNGDKMELTFDVSRLMVLIEKAGSLTGNNTIKGVSVLLNQYDGMTAGFELQRQK
ncbi:DUF4923 family protein [uncultured Duncaniella sp.]|uniref:lipocalin-like domain-containing protein n=1 Tax=uncultured Duncaniella sp. TaxID=2768039 RepID=UPI0025ECC67A|nr:DUF4923 family protein [uncultured Duncaniella sp.]